jgi:hypothetical protein
LEQFLRAMGRAEERAKERAEKKTASAREEDSDTGDESPGKPLDKLSHLMRGSWATRRFWFNYAARKPFDVEELFDYCIKGEEGGGVGANVGIEALDEEAREGLEAFVEMKMGQLKAYDEECARCL